MMNNADMIARAMAMDAKSSADAAQATADGKADLVDGKVPASELPSYVDDVADGYMYQGRFYVDAQHTQEITGEKGKVYLDIATNTSYRWSGNAFVALTGQADWNQTDTTQPNYIKNKPTLGTASALNVAASGNASTTEVVKGDDSRLTDSRTPTAHTHTVNQITDFPTLATVATSGNYNDLTNKPTIPAAQVNADWNAVSGVAQILNKPTIPDAQIQSDWNQSDSTAKDYIKNKPALGTAAAKDMDSALNANSTNPVQNSTLYTKFLDIDANIAAIRVMMDAVLYGYRVNKNDSNPETRVEYLYDAVGMTPARMNYTTGIFDYGSWADVWFVTENKPCAVNYNGTVDYYLDPTDYTKKADGTASDLFVLLTEEPSDWATKYTGYFTKDENDDFVFVTGESAPAFAADTYYTNSAYTGNFMAQMPTVWFKRWEDTDYEYVAICNKQLNSDFKACAHDAGDGYINPYTYLPMFKGVTIGGKLRSIVGVKVEGNTSGSQEKSRAEANGAGWQLWDWAKHELISDLLTLISRTSNSQAAFGQGDTNTFVNDASQNYGKLNTGQHKVDGVWKLYGSSQFYGESNDKHHVRVFHIEDFWGNRFDRCLGLNLVNMEYKYKMVRQYALDSDSSYVSSGLTAPASGWQKTMYAGEFGTLPKTVGGSQTTYVCDYFWSSSGTRLALFGGSCSVGTLCGSRSLTLDIAASYASWYVGGSPCFNPPHEGV